MDARACPETSPSSGDNCDSSMDVTRCEYDLFTCCKDRPNESTEPTTFADCVDNGDAQDTWILSMVVVVCQTCDPPAVQEPVVTFVDTDVSVRDSTVKIKGGGFRPKKAPIRRKYIVGGISREKRTITQDPEPIDGLVSGTIYFVYAIDDDDNIRFAETCEDAENDKFIEFGSTGSGEQELVVDCTGIEDGVLACISPDDSCTGIEETACTTGPYIPYIKNPEMCANTQFGSKCRKWKCADDLEPFGDPRCKSSGGWDLDDTFCGCGDMPYIPYAFDTSYCEGTQVGELCEYWICPYGQIPKGFAVCTKTGEWNTQSAYCGCPFGTKMNYDGSCQDINECATPMAKNCEKCYNGYGSYYCHCSYGHYFVPGEGCVAMFNNRQYNGPPQYQPVNHNPTHNNNPSYGKPDHMKPNNNDGNWAPHLKRN